MEISANYSEVNNSVVKTNENVATNQNSNLNFSNGAVVKGEILDINKDGITVKLENGQTINGLIDDIGNAKIGDTTQFTLSHDTNNNLKFTISEGANSHLENAKLKETLQSYGFKGSSEQIKMAKALIDGEFALTKENFIKLNQTVHLLGKDKIDQALFMMKNNMDINSQNANILNGFTDGTRQLSSQLMELADLLNNIPEGDSKNQLLNQIFQENNVVNNVLANNQTQILDSFTSISEKLTIEIANLENTENLSHEKIETILKELPNDKEVLEQLSSKLKEEFPLLKNSIDSIVNQKLNLLEVVENNKDFIGKELLNAEKNGFSQIDTFNQTLKTLTNNENIFSNNDMAELSEKLLNYEKNSVPYKFMEKFSLNLEDIDNKDVEAKLNRMQDSLNNLKNALTSTNLDSTTKENINNNLNNIENTMKFVSTVKTEIFLQLPVTVNSETLNSEIHIFNNKRNKNTSKNNVKTVLVALDTLSVGRYEVYVTKKGQNIHCQFRLDTKEIENLTVENLDKLKDLLKIKNFNLEGYGFTKNGEKFKLGDKEPINDFFNAENTTNTPAKTLTGFDFRT